MHTLAEQLSRPIGDTGSELGKWRRMMGVGLMHLERNARVFSYFKMHAGLQLLQGIVQVVIFLFVGRLMGFGRFSSLIGGSYASFLIIGMVLLQYLDKSLIAPYVSLSGAYWSARLESLLLSPYSLWLFIVTDTVWYYLMTTINATAIFFVGIAFGASVDTPRSWVLLIFTFFLAGTAVFGLGLVSASTFSLLNAKGNDEPVGWGVHLVQGLVTGLYFPAALLPHGMQAVGLLLPHTYAIDSMRRLLLSKYTPGPTLIVHNWFALDPIVVNLACIALCLLVYLPSGIYLFNRGIAKSREAGSLSRWT